MLEAFGETQKKLLHSLLNHKRGLSADQFAEKLSITRTAVRQHMATMEELGLVEHGPAQETGGRPAIIYILSAKGYELFPKQYSWFSELLLQMIRDERGTEGLAIWMDEMGKLVGKSVLPKLTGIKGGDRLEAIAAIMTELAYEAKTVNMKDSSSGSGIEATNCVYHSLASRFPEVCRFDLSLLATLTGGEVDHSSCMVRGGESCRFAFRRRP